MHLIQPCCTKKHLLDLRTAIKYGGTAQFEGYGDLSLTELLPALLTRYAEVRMMIVAPSLPDQAAEVIGTWMQRHRARTDGKGNMDVIRHLTVIADLSQERSPTASMWLKQNPFGERLELRDIKQEETAILLPDFAITGPVNMRYGYHFIATATSNPERISALWEQYRAMTAAAAAAEPAAEPEKKHRRTKRQPKTKQKKQHDEQL